MYTSLWRMPSNSDQCRHISPPSPPTLSLWPHTTMIPTNSSRHWPALNPWTTTHSTKQPRKRKRPSSAGRTNSTNLTTRSGEPQKEPISANPTPASPVPPSINEKPKMTIGWTWHRCCRETNGQLPSKQNDHSAPSTPNLPNAAVMTSPSTCSELRMPLNHRQPSVSASPERSFRVGMSRHFCSMPTPHQSKITRSASPRSQKPSKSSAKGACRRQQSELRELNPSPKRGL